MNRIYLMTTALAAIGYVSDTCETVLANIAGGGDPVRVNKSDFDADQAKPAGEREYTAHKTADKAVDGGGATSTVNLTGAGEGGEILTTAAPSAPDFSGGDAAPLLMDEAKGAAAPVTTDAGQWLVMKSGRKFFIADGLGKKIEGDDAKLAGIDEKGYDTEAAARVVIDTTSR